MILRFVFSLMGGSLIALLIFWFMVGLITQPHNAQQPDQTVTAFEMLQAPPPPPKTPPPEPAPTPPQPTTQPATDVMAISPVQPIVAQELQLPALDLAPTGLAVNAIAGMAGRWSAPLGDNSAGLLNPVNGFIDITPLSTRRPNIPEIAWKNKINGWVIVAFTLGSNGHPRNVRVLDANPRGIFEDSVVSSVSNWIYDPALVNSKNKIVITQKIELFWKDFPENDPYR